MLQSAPVGASLLLAYMVADPGKDHQRTTRLSFRGFKNKRAVLQIEHFFRVCFFRPVLAVFFQTYEQKSNSKAGFSHNFCR